MSEVKTEEDIEKYYKKYYQIESIATFKDVPGWCNDAEEIYKMMVDRAKDGDHFVEIGTLLGQSASMMGTYINESNKTITILLSTFGGLLGYTLISLTIYKILKILEVLCQN